MRLTKKAAPEVIEAKIAERREELRKLSGCVDWNNPESVEIFGNINGLIWVMEALCL
jgi:hypothetical protein